MFSTTRLVERIREEYAAMPGLKLTREQACRLWGVGQETCTAALETLLAEGFLHETGTGKYVALPRPGGAATGGTPEQLSAQLVLRCPHCGKRNVVEQAQAVPGRDLMGTVRCEGCHRILSFHQQSA
jgi:DNA-directed RNA polymerase subunit RPC12/RpoP